FAQAEVRQESNTHSTGLGLTFCKIAIDAHREEIGVNSEEYSEVEFWFTLPYEKDESLMNIISQPVSSKKELKESGLLNELLTLKTFEILKIEQKVNELVNAESISSDIAKSILELAYSGDNNLYQQFIKKNTNS
ncbi:MAG: hypothetical protein JEZ09_19825, partial [Salinivirgaceae bacterium]|nr:hypothetical protein [Salinivirgaceae bacterium]